MSEIANPGECNDDFRESVIVIHDDGGGARAFANVCRHRGSRLLDGEGGCLSMTVPIMRGATPGTGTSLYRRTATNIRDCRLKSQADPVALRFGAASFVRLQKAAVRLK
jgi:hypothetical protein